VIKKILFLGFLISLPFTALAGMIDYTTKAAVVDVQTILENSVAVQNLRKEMEKLSENIHEEMSKKETELKKAEQELVNKKSSLTEEAFQKEVDKFNVKVSKAQKHMQSKKEELETIHADAMNQVHEATIEIISKLADERGFNMAIPSSQILFVKGYLDITPEVLNKLNANMKNVQLKEKNKK
jgi:Skp family chaperone for outer membrane proteins